MLLEELLHHTKWSSVTFKHKDHFLFYPKKTHSYCIMSNILVIHLFDKINIVKANYILNCVNRDNDDSYWNI